MARRPRTRRSGDPRPQKRAVLPIHTNTGPPRSHTADGYFRRILVILTFNERRYTAEKRLPPSARAKSLRGTDAQNTAEAMVSVQSASAFAATLPPNCWNPYSWARAHDVGNIVACGGNARAVSAGVCDPQRGFGPNPNHNPPLLP